MPLHEHNINFIHQKTKLQSSCMLCGPWVANFVSVSVFVVWNVSCNWNSDHFRMHFGSLCLAHDLFAGFRYHVLSWHNNYSWVAGAFSFVPFLDMVFRSQLEFCIAIRWALVNQMSLIMMNLLSVSLDFSCVTRCEHEKVASAVNCILSLIGDKNPERFFVATQDADLREKLREVLTIFICSVYLYFFFSLENKIEWTLFPILSKLHQFTHVLCLFPCRFLEFLLYMGWRTYL